jgi:hypothetical protein
MEKRKYRKGFHISWNKRQKTEKTGDKTEYLVANQPEKDRKSAINSTHPDQKSLTAAWNEEKSSVTHSIQKGSSENGNNQQHVNLEDKTDSNSSLHTMRISELEKSKKNTTKHSGYLYLLTAMATPFLAFNKKRNYKLASWANSDQRNAQWIIGISTTIAFFSSYLLGRILNVEVPEQTLPAALALAGTGGALYFASKSLNGRVSGSMLLNSGAYFGTFTLGAMHVMQEPESPYVMSTGLIILFTFLLSLGLVISWYLIAGLSCTIACNGYGIAAVAVLLGGAFLTSFLFMLGILNVYRKKDQVEQSFVKKAALYALIVIAVGALLVLMLSFL